LNDETVNIGTPAPGKLGPMLLSASTISGDDVYNRQGEKLGSIKDLMMDIRSGRVCYAVLSFGGFLSLGEKLFAVPWSALAVDAENKRLLLDTNEERLKDAPGFDKDNWPNMADPFWEENIQSFYGNDVYMGKP
jgi:sporulation protein YlmC with PRC-barrel domain